MKTHRLMFMILSTLACCFLSTALSAAVKPSPDEVIQMLSQGNQRFVRGDSLHPHTGKDRLGQAGTENQGDHAYATVITCSDSRVPVERIFDAGVMDIFVIRVAGNVVDTDEAGSIEYGLAHVHTPVLVVLGHTQCGAVTAVTHALNGQGHALEINIPPLVDNIIPAVERAQSLYASVQGDAIIPHAIEENVWQGIEDLFMKSPSSRDLVKSGKVKVIGAIYDVGSGRVNWMPQAPVSQILARVQINPAREMKALAGDGHGGAGHEGAGYGNAGSENPSHSAEVNHGAIVPVPVTLADDTVMKLLKTDWLTGTGESRTQEILPGLSSLFWTFCAILGVSATGTLFLFGTGMFKRFSLNLKLYSSYGILIFLSMVMGLGGYLYLDRVNGAAHQETAFLELDMMSNEIESFQNAFLLHGIENRAYGDKMVEKVRELVGEFKADFTALKDEGHLKSTQKEGLSRIATLAETYARNFNTVVTAFTEVEAAKETLEELSEKIETALEKMTHHHGAKLAELEMSGKDIGAIRHHTRILKLLGDAEILSLQVSHNEVEFMLDKNPERIEQMAGTMGLLNGNIRVLGQVIPDQEEKALLKEVDREIQAYTTALKRVISDEARLMKLTAETTRGLHDIAGVGEGLSHNAALLADAMQREGDMALIALILLSVLSGSLLSFFIARGISRPINAIIDGMREGAVQVAQASDQVSSSSQSMAEGASEQAASIEETSSSMEEMASMTKTSADNAGEVDGLMKEANGVVETANASMSQLTVSMADISKASEETSKIIKTIDEIAFQTNLLALNAAVEAARAGEAGAGFAVVADEVRNLAMRAAEAAKDTAQLIEGTVKKVNDGSELVAVTNEAFGKVAESTARIGTLVSEISMASGEQSNGIDMVNTAINEMSRVVQTNAANAEESAAASEELNAQAAQLKAYVGSMVQLITGKRDMAVNEGHRAVRQIPAPTGGKDGRQKKKLGLLKKNEVRPEQVLSIDQEDAFKDF